MKRKLAVVFGVLCAAAFLQGAVSVSLLHRVRHTEQQLADAGAGQAAVTTLQLQHLQWLQNLSMTIYGGETFTGTLDPQACEVGLWLADAGAHSDPAMRELAVSIDSHHREMHAATARILDLLASGDRSQAGVLFETAVIPGLNGTVEGLGAAGALYEQQVEQQGLRGTRIFTAATRWTVTIAAFSAALCALAFVLLHRRLSPPLRRLTAAVERIARGEPQGGGGLLHRSGIPDELDHLAAAIQRVADTAQSHWGASGRGDTREEMRSVSDAAGALTWQLERLNRVRVQMAKNRADVAGACAHGLKTLMAGNRKNAREQQQLMREIPDHTAACRVSVSALTDIVHRQQRLTNRVGNEMLRVLSQAAAAARCLASSGPSNAGEIRALSVCCGDASARLAHLLRRSAELADDAGFVAAQAELALRGVESAAATASVSAEEIVLGCHAKPLHPLTSFPHEEEVSQVLEQLAGELGRLTVRLQWLAGQCEKTDTLLISGAEMAV